MIGTILFSTTAISTILHLVKNNAADNGIRRSGKIISKDNRSLSEKLISFLKDYAYLAVPGLNLVKSFKKFISDDITYRNERLAKLSEYERIQDKKVETPAKKIVKKEKEIPQVKKSTPSLPSPKIDLSQPRNNADIFDSTIDTIEYTITQVTPQAKKAITLGKKTNLTAEEQSELNSSKKYIDLMNKQLDAVVGNISGYINECNHIGELNSADSKFLRMDKVLRGKFNEIKSLNPNDPELNLIVKRVKIYDSIIMTIRNRISTLNQSQGVTRK